MKNTEKIKTSGCQSRLLPLTVFFFLISSPFSWALSVKPVNVRQLVKGSNCIVKGVIKNGTIEADPYESGRLVKYYTLKVDEALKGGCVGDFIFKQLARGPRGLPEYQLGKTYLLFLPRPSEETGLVAPLGFWQGRYELIQDGGRWLVPALRENTAVTRSLKTELKSLSPGRGDSDSTPTLHEYETFRSVIEHILKESE